MKLHELGTERQIDNIEKVCENYLGSEINFRKLDAIKAQTMLNRVSSLLDEHRHKNTVYQSEHNPGYLKLLMLEQGLSYRIKELNTRLIRESELQQAQVVLAGQDMVDQMQKILEQISEMQYKDLPALSATIKNDVGTAQAQQFQTQANQALQSLIQSVQEAKNQLENANMALSGEQPIVPGAAPDIDGDSDIDADLNLDADNDTGEEDLDLSLDANLDDKALGRERR